MESMKGTTMKNYQRKEQKYKKDLTKEIRFSCMWHGMAYPSIPSSENATIKTDLFFWFLEWRNGIAMTCQRNDDDV